MAGQIINRGEKKWLIRIYLGREAGKRIYHNTTYHGTKKGAEKLCSKLLTQADEGTLTTSTATVGTLLDDLLEDYRINDKSLDWAEIVVKHLKPIMGKVAASKLSTKHIKGYIAHRQKTVSNGTINREMTILRRALNLGREASPPKVVRVPKIVKLEEAAPRKGFFEHDAFLAVRDELPEQIRPVFIFGYYTGCRLGEILKLKWSQVDLSERVVRLEPGETKNKDARLIPLTGDLYSILELQKQRRDEYFPDCQWVFSRYGQPIKDFRWAWAKACFKAGLWEGDEETGKPTKLFHDLRRTGVRNLVRAGVPERVAMMISGHRTRSVFDRYNIVDERDLKEAALRLGTYLESKTQETEEKPESSERHTIGTQPPKQVVQ